MAADHVVAGEDEHRHEPGPEPLWNESWYMDFTDLDGRVGGYVRLGLYPNLGVSWYWACLVGRDDTLVTVIEHQAPVPPGRSLEIRTEGLWADHTVETALDHFTLGCEAFAVRLDDPADVYGPMRGARVPFALDLEWETEGEPYAYPGVTRYEVPCRVHGEIQVEDERIEFDGTGQRDHSWGVRDWWTFGWVWTSGRLDDGTRFHGSDIRVPELDYAPGYIQSPGHPLATFDVVQAEEDLGEHGFPSRGSVRLGELSLEIEPVAFSPVLLSAPDGRVSRFPRALCRFREADGTRAGVGWTEWNQPQPR